MNLSDLVLTANTGADAIKRAPIVDENTGVKCLRIGDVSQKRSFSEWGNTKTTDADYQRYKLEIDDLIIARTGNTIGVNTFIDTDVNSVYNNGLIRIKADISKVIPRYFWYLISSNDCQNFVQSIAYGTSTQPNMKINDFLRYSFEYQSLDVQRKIIDIIDPIDKKIKTNEAINRNLEEQANAIYKSWFIDFSTNKYERPNSWLEGTLGDLTSLVARGITPRYTEDSEELVINQKCIRNHLIDLSIARSHSPKVINEKWVCFGDLLLNSTGTGTLGRAAQVWFEPKKLTVDTHITIVRPKRPELIYYIGFWGLNNEGAIESLHTGSTGQTELPRDRIRSMRIILPDDVTLSKFNDIIKPITLKIVQNLSENAILSQVRDSILPKLMSGKVDISDVEI